VTFHQTTTLKSGRKREAEIAELQQTGTCRKHENWRHKR